MYVHFVCIRRYKYWHRKKRKEFEEYKAIIIIRGGVAKVNAMLVPEKFEKLRLMMQHDPSIPSDVFSHTGTDGRQMFLEVDEIAAVIAE